MELGVSEGISGVGRGHAESTGLGTTWTRGEARDSYFLGFGALKITVLFVNPEPKLSLPPWFPLFPEPFGLGAWQSEAVVL